LVLVACLGPLCCARAAAAQDAQVEQVVSLQGVVLDPSGLPLAGAWVAELERGLHVRSAEDGSFALQLPAAGPVRLRVSLPGYADLELEAQAPGQGLRLVMDPGLPAGGEAVGEIVVESAPDSASPVRHVLDREQVERTPGTHGDAARLVQAMPGVAVTREYAPGAGDLAIRGSGPDEHRFMLDGLELPYLFHFREFTSVVDLGLLDELALYPSAFGAEFGDATGAVVAGRTRATFPERPEAGIDLNAIMSGAHLRSPLGGDFFLSGSGRRSYMDWIVGGASGQYTSWPVFWDGFLRLDHVPDPDHRTALEVLLASDRWERLVREPEELDPVEAQSEPLLDYRHQYVALALRRRDAGSAGQLEGMLGLVLDRWPAQLQQDWQDRKEASLQLREDAVWLASDELHLALGLRARAERSLRRAETAQAWPEVASEAPMLARGLAADELLQRLRAGAYAELRAELGSWRLLPGLRLDGDSMSGAISPDPRLGFKWRPIDALTLRGGLGRYSQFPSTDALSPQTGDPDLPATRSEQAALGLDGQLAGRLRVSADVYAKRLRDMVLEEVGEPPIGGVQGRVAGLELGSSYRIRGVFFAWLSASLSLSQRQLEDSWIPFDWYQPLSLGAVASWTFRPGWSAGFRWRYGSGFPYTPVVDGQYRADSDSYDPVLGERNSAVMPHYQKFDLRLERSWERPRWRISLYVEAWFIPEPSNLMYPVYSYDYDESTFVEGPRFVPIIGLRGEVR